MRSLIRRNDILKFGMGMCGKTLMKLGTKGLNIDESSLSVEEASPQLAEGTSVLPVKAAILLLSGGLTSHRLRKV